MKLLFLDFDFAFSLQSSVKYHYFRVQEYKVYKSHEIAARNKKVTSAISDYFSDETAILNQSKQRARLVKVNTFNVFCKVRGWQP